MTGRATRPGPALSDIPILVQSLDENRDLWLPFFELFFRFWPECPHRVFVQTNVLECPDPRVESLQSGPKIDYSTNLLAAIGKLDAEYLILWIDDRPPVRQVDQAVLHSWLREALELEVAYLKLLVASPFGQTRLGEQLAAVDPGTKFRASTTIGLWRRSVLESLLVAGEDPWQAERRMSARSAQLTAPFATVRYRPKWNRPRAPVEDLHISRRGRLLRRAKRQAASLGLDLADHLDRPVAPPWIDTLVWLWDVWVETLEFFTPRKGG